MNMVQSMRSFLISDPISFNQSLRNRCQTFGSKNPLPNILSRLIIGVIIKDITCISAIAIHIIVGLAKLTICATKLIYSIPARLWGSIPNYEIGKEGFSHLGFSTFYLADIFISLTNLINRYPKDLIERVENFFSRFLSPKTNVVNREEVQKPLLSSESEVTLDKLTLTTQETALETSPLHKEDPLYLALLESGEDPEKSKILVANYRIFPKHFRHSINSVISEY